MYVKACPLRCSVGPDGAALLDIAFEDPACIDACKLVLLRHAEGIVAGHQLEQQLEAVPAEDGAYYQEAPLASNGKRVGA